MKNLNNLLSAIYVSLLGSCCFATENNLQDLKLPLLESHYSNGSIDFTYSAQSVSLAKCTSMPDFDDIKKRYGDDVFKKVAAVYFHLEYSLRYTQFGFEIPVSVADDALLFSEKASKRIYRVLNSSVRH